MSRLHRLADLLFWISGVAAATAVVLLFTLEGGDDEGTRGIDGAEIYGAHCAVCHGSSGQGASGPRLVDAASIVADDPAAAVATISLGRNAMPGFDAVLSTDEIAAVTDFVRSGVVAD